MARPLIVGFNGSPRKYGNTFKALRLALLAAEEEGVETILLNLYDLDIKPCIACLTEDPLLCRYPCVIGDDMRKVYDHILKAGGMVVATPIFWYNVSGVVKNFIDRLTVFENMIHVEGRSWLEGKLAAFIAMGNDSGPIAVIQNLMAVFNSMGVHIPPWALAYYSRQGDVLEAENVVLDAANIGWIMARTLQGLEEGRPPASVGYSADSEARERAWRLAERVRREAEENMRRHSLLRLIGELKAPDVDWVDDKGNKEPPADSPASSGIG